MTSRSVAHAATLRSRVPFLHFFDGFRTSHEIDKIATLARTDDMRALVREEDVLAFRGRGLTPEAPVVRGTAQNPDVFFQAREAANPYYLALPGIVQGGPSRSWRQRTGREYGLVDYHGAPDADRVIVVMGSAAGAVAETVDALVAAGERVGMLRSSACSSRSPRRRSSPRCRRPCAPSRCWTGPRSRAPSASRSTWRWSRPSTRRWTATRRRSRIAPRIVGGRYGLSSKEFTPAMVKPVFDALAEPRPKRHFTVGIVDDVTHLSLPIDTAFRLPRPAGEVQALFFGLGSDGTVGANKASVKIIGEGTDLYAQGYFVYDSKKSGSVTTSHLRFGPRAHPVDLPGPGGGLHRLPPVRPAVPDAGPGQRPPRRHVPAQLALRPRRGLGPPARPRPAPARGQGHRPVGHRRVRGRGRGRHGQSHQHRDAALLLPPRRACCRAAEAIARIKGFVKKTYCQAR